MPFHLLVAPLLHRANALLVKGQHRREDAQSVNLHGMTHTQILTHSLNQRRHGKPQLAHVAEFPAVEDCFRVNGANRIGTWIEVTLSVAVHTCVLLQNVIQWHSLWILVLIR